MCTISGEIDESPSLFSPREWGWRCKKTEENHIFCKERFWGASKSIDGQWALKGLRRIRGRAVVEDGSERSKQDKLHKLLTGEGRKMGKNNTGLKPQGRHRLALRVLGAFAATSIIIVLLWYSARKPTIVEVDIGIVETNLSLEAASEAARRFIAKQGWAGVATNSDDAVGSEATLKTICRAKTADGNEIAFELRPSRSGPWGSRPALPTSVYITKDGDSGQLQLAAEFAAYLQEQFGSRL